MNTSNEAIEEDPEDFEHKLSQELSEASDDDEDPWKHLAEDPWKDHLVPVPEEVKEMGKVSVKDKKVVNKNIDMMYCPLCDQDDHVILTCPIYDPTYQACQLCDKWDHNVLDCKEAHFICTSYYLSLIHI